MPRRLAAPVVLCIISTDVVLLFLISQAVEVSRQRLSEVKSTDDGNF